MGRFPSKLCAALALVASPLLAADREPSDCSRWVLRGVRVGMSFEEVEERRDFEDRTKARMPSGFQLGYRVKFWQAKDRAEKLDLHVDVRSDPSRIIGVTITVPTSITSPQDFAEKMIRQWGEPNDVSKQGAFALYSWVDDECGVSARLTAMKQAHEVGVFAVISSNEGREEYERRRAEADAIYWKEEQLGRKADDDDTP